MRVIVTSGAYTAHMNHIRLLLVIASSTVVLFAAVNYLSQNVISPTALALNMQPLFIAVLLCVPLSILSQRLKHS